MSQSIKIYGLIFLACICLLLFLDFDRKLIMEDSLFESVRTTQLSVLDDALNRGDLIVNQHLSINKTGLCGYGMKRLRKITVPLVSWKSGMWISMRILLRLQYRFVNQEKRR